MGPLFTGTDEWTLVISLVIGIGFGYILESAGFSSSRKLVGVFYGYDFSVIRVFFMAAVTAAIGLAYFGYLGWIDLSAIYINKFYLGSTILGGIFMGLGFIIGGFCPGTSVCAASIGKIDAIIFIGGVMIGSLIFSLAYPLYANFYTSGAKGAVTIYDMIGISKELAIFIFVVFAVITFYFTAEIQKKISEKSHKY